MLHLHLLQLLCTAPPLTALLPSPHRFDLRILVPCYKEDLEVVENTVKAILNADYPHNTTRTVYLCDDGNDPLKRDFANKVSDVVYVTGRYREKGGWRSWLAGQGRVRVCACGTAGSVSWCCYG